MADTNLSLVVYKKGDLRLEDRPIQEPGKGEVQVCMKAVGICGTDVHLWTTGALGSSHIVTTPLVLGHEFSGVVFKVGEDVTHLKAGDRVTMEPMLPCRSCDYCKAGRYNLCRKWCAYGVPPGPDGGIARYHNHTADLCFRIPAHVSFEEAALFEPLSVAIRACQKVPITLSQKIFIGGAGPVGLLCMLAAKAMGAGDICISDICEPRLRLAKKLGADHTLLIDSKDAKATAEKVIEIMGCMPDVTIECSGVAASVQTGIHATRSGGVFMQVGLGDENVTIPLVDAAIREVEIRSSFAFENWRTPMTIEMVASGRIDVKPLVTHHFSLERSLEALELARTGGDECVKIMIHCDRDWKP